MNIKKALKMLAVLVITFGSLSLLSLLPDDASENLGIIIGMFFGMSVGTAGGVAIIYIWFGEL